MNSIVKNYAGHLAGYIVGLATLVSGIDPKLLPPQYAVLTSIAGLVLIGAHHGYTAGNVAGIANAALAAANSAAQAATKTGAAAVLLCLLAFAGGCASTPQLNAGVSQASAVVTSAQAQPILAAAADVAVATAEQHGITAAQITSIAQQALAADSGGAASLATIGTLVNAQLAKLNLPAADLAAAQIVEVALGAAIQTQIGGNATAAQAQAAVADILQAILKAAAGPPAPTAPATTTGATAAPASSKGGAIEALESPTVVGAATGTVVVWGLQAFAHVTVPGAVAAAGVVLWTVVAAYLHL